MIRRLGRIKARRGRPPAARAAILKEGFKRRSLSRENAVSAIPANNEKGTLLGKTADPNILGKDHESQTRAFHQPSFCLFKRLYQGGFISFEARQAAYKFNALHCFYLSTLKAPQYARVHFYGKGMPLTEGCSPYFGLDQEGQNSQEEIKLWEWRQIYTTLQSFGVKGEYLLKEALRERSTFQTCDDIYLLRDILEALANTFSGFWSNSSESSCALRRQTV